MTRGSTAWRRPRRAARRRSWPSSRFDRCRRRAGSVRSAAPCRRGARRRGQRGARAADATSVGAGGPVTASASTSGSLPTVAMRSASVRSTDAWRRDGMGTTATGRCPGARPAGQHRHHRVGDLGADAARRGPISRRGSASQAGSSANARARPTPQPLIRPLRPASPAGQSLRGSITTSAVRRWARAASTVAAAGVAPGCGQLAGAHRAPPARAGVGVVERLLQELHQAALARRRTARMRSASAARTRGWPPTSPRRTRPWRAGGDPAVGGRARPRRRPRSPSAALRARPRRSPVAVSSAGTLIGAPARRARRARRRRASGSGMRGGGEVLPHALVGSAGQQHRHGARRCARPARPTCW